MNWVVVGAGLRYPVQQSSRPCSTLVTVEASRGTESIPHLTSGRVVGSSWNTTLEQLVRKTKIVS